MDAPASRADLEALVLRFADAFNRHDLDDVLHFVQGRLQRKQTYSRARLPLARRSPPAR